MLQTTIRAGRIVAGVGLLLAGAVLLVIPGPGSVLLIGGLALLGHEFHWARRANEWLREQARRVVGRSDG
jgi:hypothetical protein